jgi:hypothetical protein
MMAPSDDNVLTLVSALDEAGMFVVFASRTHRSNQEGAREPQCLCYLFHAAGLCGAQVLFVELQQAITSDADAGFVANNRGTPLVSRPEMLLLRALAHWQRHPQDFSDHALAPLLSPTVRRIASPLVRQFAQAMVHAGLILSMKLPEAEVERPSPQQRVSMH